MVLTRRDCQELGGGSSRNLRPKEKFLVKFIAVTFSLSFTVLFYLRAPSFLLSPLFSPLNYQNFSLLLLSIFHSLLSLSSCYLLALSLIFSFVLFSFNFHFSFPFLKPYEEIHLYKEIRVSKDPSGGGTSCYSISHSLMFTLPMSLYLKCVSC